MAWTKVGEAVNDGSDTIQLTTVGTGDAIVILTAHEDTAGTVSISDGTSSFTGATQDTMESVPLTARLFYLLASVATGTVTYTVNWGGGTTFRRLLAYRFTYTGTASLDGETATDWSAASGANPTSGNISPAGTDNVTIGYFADGSGNVESDPEINNVNATGSLAGSFGDLLWYRTHTVGFTGAADVTMDVASNGVIGILSMKAVAAAGAVAPSVNEAVTVTESVSMKMNLQNMAANDAVTIAEAVSMHMPIAVRMYKP